MSQCLAVELLRSDSWAILDLLRFCCHICSLTGSSWCSNIGQGSWEVLLLREKGSQYLQCVERRNSQVVELSLSRFSRSWSVSFGFGVWVGTELGQKVEVLVGVAKCMGEGDYWLGTALGLLLVWSTKVFSSESSPQWLVFDSVQLLAVA